ncbi:hypothetical protein F5148DRAFT_252894 [Russula earlei]|uniref:Uncharacterized protein n=1 Tax=Russula earlei TaxID=71964 RepID=A0ACC0U4M4_9AGAM|nr:hypothetical protein F5148DRAFT_252894 [Russula earlei]
MGKLPRMSLLELDGHISSLQNTLSSLLQSYPRRVYWLQLLAMARYERHRLSGQVNDLDMSILHFTETIFLPLPWHGCPLNITQVFSSILAAFSRRSYVSRQSGDVKWCIKYLHYLSAQPPDPFNLIAAFVAGDIVSESASKTELEPRDRMQYIDEMAVVYHNLLKSGTSIPTLSDAIMAFVGVVRDTFGTQRELSEKVIGFLSDMNKCVPDSHKISMALAESLFGRFERTLSNDDYEEGVAILDKIICSHAPGDRPSEFRGSALRLSAWFAITRANKCGKPEYVGKEICRFRTLLAGASLEDPVRPHLVEGLHSLQRQLDLDFGVPAGHRDVDPAVIPPFRDLSVSLSQSNGGGSTERKLHVEAISAYDRITEMVDIVEAIKYYRLVLASSTGFSRDDATSAAMALGRILHKAFSRTDNIDHLNESISVLRDRLTVMIESFDHLALAMALVESLYTRFLLLYHREDLDEIVQVCHLAVNNQRATTPSRSILARFWARAAHCHSHPSTSAAYDSVISLMQHSLTFTPTLDTQHFRLAALPNGGQLLPLDYASYLVHSGRLEKAIETLERGRALLWSEMRGLRTSIDQLRAAEPRFS